MKLLFIVLLAMFSFSSAFSEVVVQSIAVPIVERSEVSFFGDDARALAALLKLDEKLSFQSRSVRFRISPTDSLELLAIKDLLIFYISCENLDIKIDAECKMGVAYNATFGGVSFARKIRNSIEIKLSEEDFPGMAKAIFDHMNVESDNGVKEKTLSFNHVNLKTLCILKDDACYLSLTIK